MIAPAIPAPRPSFIVYFIVDVATTPPTLVDFETSRSDARKAVERQDSGTLRIRRARVQLFQS